jgi:hypothetical protein
MLYARTPSGMNGSMQFNDGFNLPFDEMSSSSLNDYNGDDSFALGEIMQQKSAPRFDDVTPPTALPDSRSYLESVYDSLRNSLQRQQDNDANEQSMGCDQLLETSVSETGHMSSAQQSSANLRVAAIWETKSKLYGQSVLRACSLRENPTGCRRSPSCSFCIPRTGS